MSVSGSYYVVAKLFIILCDYYLFWFHVIADRTTVTHAVMNRSPWSSTILSPRVSPWPQVRFGQQKRYQDWFQRQYLSTAESQSLRCDLIRYICGVVHPSNEVLSSDILPRWAIIGWLLTTCTVNNTHTHTTCV